MIRLGQKLHDERIKKGLALEQIAKDLKIKPHFLVAIENGEYNLLPDPAYAQGFVRNYADYLGFPNAQISALFKRDFDEKKATKVLPDGMTQSQEFSLKRISIRRVFIGTASLFLLLGFLLFQYRFMFLAPSINIKSPKDGSVVTQDVTILGKTDSDAIVTVNNEPVFVNNNGEFVKKITFFPGNTNFVVKAKNRLGRETTLQRSITVK